MTLKEKFMKLIEIPFKDKGVYIDMNKVEECEKIADEFAIGFADWIRVCKLKGRPYDFENIKELLTIYKEEKDL
jgi:hypothetical protein